MTFKAYDIVSHPVYGEGTVTRSIKPDEDIAHILWDNREFHPYSNVPVNELTKLDKVHNDIKYTFAHSTFYPTVRFRKPLLGYSGAMEAIAGYQAVISNDYRLITRHNKKEREYLKDYIEPGDILVQFKDFHTPWYPDPFIYHSKKDFLKDFYKLQDPLEPVKTDSFLSQKEIDYAKAIISRYKEEQQRVQTTPRARMRKIYLD